MADPSVSSPLPTTSGSLYSLATSVRATRPPGGCNVDFTIHYELKSLTLQMLVGGLFDRAFRKYAEAFEARAHAIYGPAA